LRKIFSIFPTYYDDRAAQGLQITLKTSGGANMQVVDETLTAINFLHAG
jgi:hypothetical protein